MRIYKANYLHLFMAGLYLAQSDREEMDRLEAGRDPINVLTASSGDPTVKHISDDSGNVLAVGGHSKGIIWFVHTTHAEALSPKRKLKMLRLLVGHLITIKREAKLKRPMDEFHYTNIVSVENLPHIKLLTYLGAYWSKRPIYQNGHEFKQFYF
ncbi:phage protein Gp13 family protein [Pseudomonas sp.]|jgi:hypothetical protein|uniref:phage protein Gp13 family protein n=1 Tax=Pseudomonas sp. TaxID=306 RepID=UPI0037CBBF5D